MPEHKSKCLLRINFLDTHQDQIVLSEYLKTGDAKSQVLAATRAYLYPLALAQQPMTTSQELELALSRSIQLLMNQAEILINDFRLNKNIVLPPEQLARLGLMSSYSGSAQTDNAAKVSVANSAIKSFTEDEDDEPPMSMNSVFDVKF
jgi:hypothetical protein